MGEKRTDLGALRDAPLTAGLLDITFISGVEGNFMTGLLLALREFPLFILKLFERVDNHSGEKILANIAGPGCSLSSCRVWISNISVLWESGHVPLGRAR